MIQVRLVITLGMMLWLMSSSSAKESFPVDSSYSIENAYQKIKKNYPGIKKVPVIVSKKIKAEYNQVYATIENSPWGKRDLHLDVFSPAKAGKYPALIMVHGGGWRSGNKSMEHAMAVRIAESGFVTIPVEYRLSLEAPYPQAIFDVKAAVRWVIANAERFNIDTARIAIEGNSAGGQIAGLVGMTNGVEQFEGSVGLRSTLQQNDKVGQNLNDNQLDSSSPIKSSIKAIVDIDGVMSLIAPGSLNLIRKPDSPDAAWLGGFYHEVPQIWKEASPAYWVNKNSVPVLFIQGTEPRFTAGMHEMRAFMDQYGVYSEYHPIRNSPHSFWLFDPWFEPTTKYIIDFLKKRLGSK